MKRTLSEETSPVDPLTLSFMDVLSCGLGAMIVLFLVFAVLPQGRDSLSRVLWRCSDLERRLTTAELRK